jgi:hypothetical protein
MRELRQHGRAIANAGNSHYPESTSVYPQETGCTTSSDEHCCSGSGRLHRSTGHGPDTLGCSRRSERIRRVDSNNDRIQVHQREQEDDQTAKQCRCAIANAGNSHYPESTRIDVCPLRAWSLVSALKRSTPPTTYKSAPLPSLAGVSQ